MRNRALRTRRIALVPIVTAVVIAGTALLLLRNRANVQRAQPAAPPAASDPAPNKAYIPYDDARPILESLREKLPADLKTKTPVEIQQAWPGWVSRHDAEIRARLGRGDEDSIVNFWLYGTSFTTQPRATEWDLARLAGGAGAGEVLIARLDDFVAGVVSPGANERLQFAREVLERHGIHPMTPAGKEQARLYLVEARARMIVESYRYRRTSQSARRLNTADGRFEAYSTLYRERGLSSDTSITTDFAIERTLMEIKSTGRLGARSIRRVAIVGPGLDFTDKAEGYDFYPQQTVQPFAFIDSLIRLGLAKSDDLRITTFDLNPRVNQHLEAARQRARRGTPYVLQLPLDRHAPGRQWHPDLVDYWQRFGDRIGDPATPSALPPRAGGVRVRAVRVRPAVVMSVVPRDVNIVLERLEALPADELFDLVVATNVLVYYDTFEQLLALANVSKMVRPGGFFLTNSTVSPTAPIDPAASLMTTVYWDSRQNGDTLFWYQRR
jgi:hypothetical protein